MPAAPAQVNAAPAYAVVSASTSPIQGGGIALQIRTTAGPMRLLFPAWLESVFAVTNPPARIAAGMKLTPIASTDGRHRSPEREALYRQILVEAQADPKPYGAISRACLRHDVRRSAFDSWLHNQRARASAHE